MKTYTKKIIINTSKRIDFVNITEKIREVVKESKVKEGLVLVNAMHITASVFINDNESGLLRDFETWLEKLAPQKFDYHHHMTGEDNGFSHLWRTIMGRSVTIAITNGELDFGPWEAIFYGEFDGKRNKKIMVKIIGR
ncbi:MAG: secondary thiamine-phosphate synthase enzyme YjbQ [archaeon]